MSLMFRTLRPLAHKPLVAFFALLLLAGKLSANEVAMLDIGGLEYRIELAQTSQQRQVGLMHRQQLGPREGMLLIYPAPGDRRIWMKNVPIPLQVFWIDENFTVIGTRRLPPCRHSPCPVYGVDGAAHYVLELGDYPHPIEKGDRIDSLRNF